MKACSVEQAFFIVLNFLTHRNIELVSKKNIKEKQISLT
ncbi:hypothetical protein NU08_4348 [Flavobacterium anhuiense]|uniref:Uncharacterized protein n=1 Tax=Flavobacterium anhuiense TaxID=459526 RepID=A0A444VSJ8_9FLAO|nr:hypothetical protein NU08_4348 [Flavobacterium anhuiense]